MCNGNTLSVWIVKGLYIRIYNISLCVYVCVCVCVCVCVYILCTWISFGLLKGLVF